jgi:hypothetical protein
MRRAALRMHSGWGTAAFPPRCVRYKPNHSSILVNCSPGNCRTALFISNSNSVARTWQEFKPHCRAMSSISSGPSAPGILQIFCQAGERPRNQQITLVGLPLPGLDQRLRAPAQAGLG